MRKENKFIQTDEGKYSIMTDEPSSYKERAALQNLKEAEGLIQDLKSQQAEYKQKIFDVET